MKLTSQLLKQKIKLWRNILDIEKKWKIGFTIKNNPLEMSDGNQDSMACILVRSGYFHASIEFNSVEIKESELDATVLHELLHIILDPLSIVSAGTLKKEHEELSSVLIESTIERLVPGYLHLYNNLYKKNKPMKKTSKAAMARKKY